MVIRVFRETQAFKEIRVLELKVIPGSTETQEFKAIRAYRAILGLVILALKVTKAIPENRETLGLAQEPKATPEFKATQARRQL
jgi:hypothetical protein